MLYRACAPLLCHLCPLCQHDMGGGGAMARYAMQWFVYEGIGTCVTCVTSAGRATMTWRGGGGASKSVPRHVP